MGSFNLMEEPWIPCLTTDGERRELSLSRALRAAGEIQEIHDPSPLVTVALHRLLLAVLHRVFGPKGNRDWANLWRRGRWNPQPLEQYFQTWHHRFYLFDQERPFAQVPYMSDAREHPIASLVLEAASGNNSTLFNHAVVEGDREIPPARAACYLLAHQAFAIGFGKSRPFYFRDGTLTRGMSLLAYGDNLFETLALNLMPEVRWSPFEDSAADKPFWEFDALSEPNPTGTWPTGRSDYLTWLSRRAHLIAEGAPQRVVRCQIQQNLCLPPENIRWDPFKRYRRDSAGWTPIGLSADKAAWRDCHALLNLKVTGEFPPQLLYWLGTYRELRDAGEIEARPECRLVVFGLSTAPGKAASVEMWRQERLPLPLDYLNNDELLGLLKACLEVADEVGSVLRRATWYLARQLLRRKSGQAGGPDVQQLADHLSLDELFWPRLEQPFHALLADLPANTGLEAWRDHLERTARAAFRTLWPELEGSGRGLRSLVAAEAFFGHELWQALRPLRKEAG